MAGPSLSVEVQKLQSATVVKLAGDIDAASIGIFQRAVEPLCQKSTPRIYLDCSSLNYVNSAGFGLFFTLTRACQQRGGKMVLCKPRPKVLNVMQVLGLEHLLHISHHPAAELAAQTNHTNHLSA